MIAPPCLKCGARHWSSQPCAVSHKAVEKVVDMVKAVVDKPIKVVDTVKPVVDTPKGKYLDAEKRKAYQREWIKKRRADGKKSKERT